MRAWRSPALPALALAGALTVGSGCRTTATLDPLVERDFYQEVVRALQGRPSALVVDPDRLDYTRLRRARAFALGEPDFTDIEAHLEKARILHDRQPSVAAFHERIALGLLDSIFADGDGRTPDRALRIYSRREQQAVLAFLGLSSVRRWSLAPDTSAAPRQLRERVDCRDTRRRPTTLYFDVTSVAPGSSGP